MPDYHFQLQPTGTGSPEQERITARDDEEARVLAEMRLLLGTAFSRVTVTRSGMEPICLTRDGRTTAAGATSTAP